MYPQTVQSKTVSAAKSFASSGGWALCISLSVPDTGSARRHITEPA